MLYITYVDLYDKSNYGVSKKVMSQIAFFEKCFGRVYYTTCRGQMIYLMEGKRVVDKGLAITRAMCTAVIEGWLDKYRVQRSYIRYYFADKWFLELLKVQKEKGIQSVLEIPTYPYDGELAEGRLKKEDNYYRRQLCQYIEWVATNSGHASIWGMLCIPLLNGVDMEANPLCLNKNKTQKIVLIGVSSMARWHGYERLLKGIFNYYANGGERDFLFKIVGEGPESGKYQKLVAEYGLESRVEFCGLLRGEALDKQYEQADIAVSSLGLYKTGIQAVTPIKGAEYCARGIPFICGYYDMRFPEGADYIMAVPNNPEPINMHKVISFYENIVIQNGYQERMRNYALEHFTWEGIMAPIVQKLK